MITTDVYPGKDLGTLELTITDEMVQHYIKGLDEPNPWYTTASPFGGPVAPVIVYQQADSEFKGWYLDNLFGNLWRRQEWEIHAPTRVGQVLRCSARVADRYRRRDREVVAQELWVRDEAGHLIARRMTLSCVNDPLTGHFGRGFYLGGRLDVKFTNVLWPNEPFPTRGNHH